MTRRARIVNNLPQFVNGVPVRAMAGMTQALVLGAAEAAALTPIDTSTLMNSQFKRVRSEGGKVTGTVGYTAEYAAAVHDPDVKQTFRREAARKEFLRLGMERAEPMIREALRKALKP